MIGPPTAPRGWTTVTVTALALALAPGMSATGPLSSSTARTVPLTVDTGMMGVTGDRGPDTATATDGHTMRRRMGGQGHRVRCLQHNRPRLAAASPPAVESTKVEPLDTEIVPQRAQSRTWTRPPTCTVMTTAIGIDPGDTTNRNVTTATSTGPTARTTVRSRDGSVGGRPPSAVATSPCP